MSNWDDWVYFGTQNDDKKSRPVILKFCLNCGKDRNMQGARYRVVGANEIALLLDASTGLDCKFCRHPIFTSSQYTLIERPIIRY